MYCTIPFYMRVLSALDFGIYMHPGTNPLWISRDDCTLSQLWWWFHGCAHMSRFIKWDILHVCHFITCQAYLHKSEPLIQVTYLILGSQGERDPVRQCCLSPGHWQVAPKFGQALTADGLSMKSAGDRAHLSKRQTKQNLTQCCISDASQGSLWMVNPHSEGARLRHGIQGKGRDRGLNYCRLSWDAPKSLGGPPQSLKTQCAGMCSHLQPHYHEKVLDLSF